VSQPAAAGRERAVVFISRATEQCGGLAMIAGGMAMIAGGLKSQS